MKKYFNFCFALLFAAGNTHAQKLTVATFNLRYDSPGDSGNLWKDRAKACADLIRFHDMAIVGTQEALPNQLADLKKLLPYMSVYGRGRDDGKDKGEHSAIFYHSGLFDLLGAGDFWFSETPEAPGKGWDATCCNRICSWVKLKEKKSGKAFYFFSSHFDHEGRVAQRESAQLLLAKIKEIAGNNPVVAVGDLNVTRDSEAYRTLENSTLLHDAYGDVKYPYENNPSFNNFGRNVQGSGVIDHIFLTGKLKAVKWGILGDTYRGKFPSDHFPVLAQIVFTPGRRI